MKKITEKFSNLNKKQKSLLFLICLTIIGLIGVSYAYLTGLIGPNASKNANVTSGPVGNLTFESGEPINLKATVKNFGENKGNIMGSTSLKAILKTENPKSTNNTIIKASYNIFFVIDNNDFEYTNASKPEILFKITDPNGNDIEYITDLKRVGDAFDITTTSGGILIASDYIIETKNQTEQTWNVEVTLVNIDEDQRKNQGKVLNGYLYMTQEKYYEYETPLIHTINTNTTNQEIEIALDLLVGSSPVSKYYYGIEEASRATGKVDFEESTDKNYTFKNLSANTSYLIYAYAYDELGSKSNIYETIITTKSNYSLPHITNITRTQNNLNSMTIEVDATPGTNNITKYLYSIDGGTTFKESTSTTYTFQNLEDTTEYRIVVKALDENNLESLEYFTIYQTATYKIPRIVYVSSASTHRTIDIKTTALSGKEPIKEYLYSIDGGTTWQNAGNNPNYHFDNLEINQEYTILVKAVDENNRESREYKLSATTKDYKLAEIKNITTKTTKNSITLNVDAEKGTNNIIKYLYSKDNGSNYIESNDNTYTFTDLTPNVTFYLKVKVVDEENEESSVYNIVVSTIPSISANVTYNGTNSIPSTVGTSASLSCTNASASWSELYNRIEISAISKENTTCTLNFTNRTSPENLKSKVSSRYRGKNPSNYIWFNNELWRIIGVIGDKVKIVRNDSIGTLVWNKSGSNNWDESTLKALLNGAYLNKEDGTASGNCYISATAETTCDYRTIGIDKTYREMIFQGTWNTGGMSSDSSNAAYYQANSGKYLQNEAKSSATAFVGLLSTSDYGYAAESSCDSTIISSFQTGCAGKNWLYGIGYEWHLTKDISNNTDVMRLHPWGYSSFENVTMGLPVRPVVFLKDEVYYISGTGTQNDPFRIGM